MKRLIIIFDSGYVDPCCCNLARYMSIKQLCYSISKNRFAKFKWRTLAFIKYEKQEIMTYLTALFIASVEKCFTEYFQFLVNNIKYVIMNSLIDAKMLNIDINIKHESFYKKIFTMVVGGEVI